VKATTADTLGTAHRPKSKGIMRSAIIDKLTAHMTVVPGTESDVVYALVQIRKLLEQAHEKDKYPWLNLFCNWVVHTKLDKGKAIDILQILEDGLIRVSFLDLSTFDKDGKAGEVLSFDLFRDELSQFCKANDLPAKWASESWRDFLSLYAEIVKDSPLTLKQPDVTKKVRQAVLTATDSSERCVEEPYPGKVVLHLDWELTLDSGHPCKFGYNLVLSDD
jgi:hypothetical protein